MNDVVEVVPGTTVVKAQPRRGVPADLTPIQLLAIAVRDGADLERVKALMDLRDREDAKQALTAFNTALAEFKRNPPVVVKDLLNKQFGSWYTSLGNLVNTVNTALGEHGLSASWDVEQGELIAVSCILEHVQGHRRVVRIMGPPDTSGSKNTLQQIRSTLTYLRGATFEAVTGIASHAANLDDDGTAAGARKQQEQEQSPPGYADWRADMAAKAEEGSAGLQEAWKSSKDEFRRHVVKFDEVWWRDCKSKASKVAAA